MKVILGISGSIAAYKAPQLVRLLVAGGSAVKCVVTENGLQFITRTVLETLSGNRVYSSLFNTGEYDPVHISLGKWADLLVVAPASADIISKYACGICDDLLTSLLLEFTAPVFLCPAMNTKMWNAWQTKESVSRLKKHGVRIIGPASGELACGDKGAGRMSEPADIVKEIKRSLKK